MNSFKVFWTVWFWRQSLAENCQYAWKSSSQSDVWINWVSYDVIAQLVQFEKHTVECYYEKELAFLHCPILDVNIVVLDELCQFLYYVGLFRIQKVIANDFTFQLNK